MTGAIFEGKGMTKEALFGNVEIEREAKRLHAKLSNLGWGIGTCGLYAPLTLEINKLKKERNALILAHNYQLPEIIFGVADFVGDSYYLSVKAANTDAKRIIFCGVRFMAETAKLLSPKKEVLLPAPDAGCSLAESISALDVRRLKGEHPDAAVVCYVNTYADVKAECDVVCTSSNALKIIEALPQEKIIFLPDKYMAQNIAALTKKQIIGWDGLCIVHKEFSAKKMGEYRKRFPQAKVLVHTECSPAVVAIADLAGGTGDMQSYVQGSDAKQFLLVTECGLSDKMKVDFPDKEFLPSCGICPHMKRNDLRGILGALKNPSKGQIIKIPRKVRGKATAALKNMLKFANTKER